MNMRNLHTAFLCTFVAATGCGSEVQRDTTTPASASTAAATHSLRIDEPHFLPSDYDVHLQLLPDQTAFEGSVTIVGAMTRDSRELLLNSKGLTIDKAVVDIDSTSHELAVTGDGEEFLRFRAEQVLPAGAATLRIDFRGTIDDQESFGIFRQRAASTPYLFTQFEARGARRAFPSYDQPDLKVPFTLTLDVPTGQLALANTPELRREDLGDGKTRFRFAKSQPLPSYLVAFAVGPFDMVDIGKTRAGVPVRIAVPKGRGDEAQYVVESTLPILAILEDYLGTPYPYAKLDLVSVPATGSFGAMENPGLVTFTESLLLSKNETVDFRRAYASVAAHEFAHQWFGNLVTTAWWDDIWLNEAFATWAQAKAIAIWKPEWRADAAWIDRRASAMFADRLASARVIAQPIATEGDIGNAFDGITYVKGASVITMFEHWLGEETFQKAIQHYLAKHQWQSASREQFLAAMDESTGRSVSPAFRSFLEQPGTPEVRFEIECVADKAPSLRMRQGRYLPLGSKADASESYQVPVCVRYAGDSGPSTECTVLQGRQGQLALTHSSECPAWIVPNAGYTGYYRSVMSSDWTDKALRKAPLTSTERMGLLSDLNAAVSSGQMPLGEALALVPGLARDKDDRIVGLAASMASLGRLVPDDDRARYASWLDKHFGKRARALGWTAREGESQDAKLLRSQLLSLLIDESADRKLAAPARALADSWLADSSSVDADLAGLAVEVAARFGDQAFFDALVRRLDSTENRGERRLALGALARFDDPALFDRALALAVSDKTDFRETRGFWGSAAAHRDNGARVLAFLTANIDTVLARVPKTMRTRLASAVEPLCDADARQKAEVFLGKYVEPEEGGARVVKKTLEQIDLCIAQKATITFPAALP